MRRTIVFLLAAAAALALAAGAVAGRIVKVGARANGTAVLLQPSDVLVVSLRGNATTGYAWRVRSVTRAVLRPTSVKYVPKAAGGKVGAGGTYVLRFRALRRGVTTLRLVYSQAGSGTVAKRFRLSVTVKSPPPQA